MTTYTAITNGEIDQDSPVTQPLLTALRDNPIAIAEGASGAPVVAAGWHPYDMVEVGDGNDGKFYDYSVDGAVANFVTPDFEDGYEYAIKLDGLSFVNDGDPRLEAYLETSAAYDTAVALSSTVTNNYVLSAKILLPGVRESLKTRHYTLEYYYREALGVPTDLSSTGRGILSQDNTAQKITKIRISPPTGNTDAGKAYLYRRRNYTTD